MVGGTKENFEEKRIRGGEGSKRCKFQAAEERGASSAPPLSLECYILKYNPTRVIP